MKKEAAERMRRAQALAIEAKLAQIAECVEAFNHNASHAHSQLLEIAKLLPESRRKQRLEDVTRTFVAAVREAREAVEGPL